LSAGLHPPGAPAQVGRTGHQQQRQEQVQGQEVSVGRRPRVIVLNDQSRQPRGDHRAPRGGVTGDLVASIGRQPPEEGGHQEQEEQRVAHRLLSRQADQGKREPVAHLRQAFREGQTPSHGEAHLPGDRKQAVGQAEEGRQRGGEAALTQRQTDAGGQEGHGLDAPQVVGPVGHFQPPDGGEEDGPQQHSRRQIPPPRGLS